METSDQTSGHCGPEKLTHKMNHNRLIPGNQLPFTEGAGPGACLHWSGNNWRAGVGSTPSPKAMLWRFLPPASWLPEPPALLFTHGVQPLVDSGGISPWPPAPEKHIQYPPNKTTWDGAQFLQGILRIFFPFLPMRLFQLLTSWINSADVHIPQNHPFHLMS